MEFPIYKIKNQLDKENKGTKEKYWTIIKNKKGLVKINEYLKDNPNKEIRSYNVSEKIYSEIANYLGFSCVKIDLIIDDKKRFGLVSYDYKELYPNMISISGDDLFYNVFYRFPKKTGKKKDNIDKKDYTYSNILKILLHYNDTGYLVAKFNSIMVMDALAGECDRHYENWGIFMYDNQYDLLPMYDNSDCLLHLFREEKAMSNQLANKTLEMYAKNSKCKVTIDGKLYTHFEFIDYLLKNLPDEMKEYLIDDIKKLNKLTDTYIKNLVYSIPDILCNQKHKELIIKYIIIRRNILLSKVVKE